MSKNLLGMVCALAVPAIFALGGCAEQTASDDVVGGTVSESESALETFKACRHTGAYVCDENVTPQYFRNHPGCNINPVCEGQYWNCDTSVCPAPTREETPNIRVKATGDVTSNMRIEIGFIWSSQYTGGFDSASLGAGTPASELMIGIGNYTDNSHVANVYCENYDHWTHKANSLVVTWVDGHSETFSCDNYECKALNLPINDGFTAYCDFKAL